MNALATVKTLEADKQPWEKQTWESWKAFEAFVMYRDIGATRSLKQVAERIIETSPKRKLESVQRQMGDWSVRHHWAARIEAYTLYMDAALVRARETEQARVNEEDLEIGDQMLRLVRNSTNVMDSVSAGIPLELVERWVQTATKTRRLALGMATDHLKAGLQITTNDASRMLNKVIDRACEFIAPEHREEFIKQVMEDVS